MRLIFFIAFFLYLSMCCRSQERLQHKRQAEFLTSIPFRKLSGGVILIRAGIDITKSPLNFILDTGASGISLDSTTCALWNVKTTPSETSIIAVGGINKVNLIFNQNLYLPNLTIDKLNFHVSDLSMLSSAYGEKIDGIIGYGFFSRYIIKINFDDLQIEIYSQGKMNYPKGGTMIYPSFIKNIPAQKLFIKDRKKVGFNFYFDTGAGVNFLLSKAFSDDSTVLLPNRKLFVVQGQGTGGAVQMRLTVLRMLQLGKYKFYNVPTYLLDDEDNVTTYPSGGGLLGNDILSRFNMIINYLNGEIHLHPNSHFNDVFDYSYTGLSIYYDNEHIYVDDVIPGSPAEKAGVLKGDVIISVDGNLTNNIGDYKTLLQSAKDRINIFINRNAKLMSFTITPLSIL